jgi:hypothetical protein
VCVCLFVCLLKNLLKFMCVCVFVCVVPPASFTWRVCFDCRCLWRSHRTELGCFSLTDLPPCCCQQRERFPQVRSECPNRAHHNLKRFSNDKQPLRTM